VPFPNPVTQFQPGQSGNPAGYSRERRAVDHLLELIAEKGADKAIAQRWLQAILEGDFRYMREYLDRRDGKVANRVDVGADESMLGHILRAAQEYEKTHGKENEVGEPGTAP